MRTWAAWWVGDPEELASVYGGAAGLPAPPPDRPGQHRGGVVGALSRMFWGSPTPPGQRATKLHLPLAGEIADTAAQLLFAAPPAVTAAGEPTQARLDELLDETTWARLLTAAETCAALGGVYLRVGWDQEVAARPLLSILGPDMAVPTFRWQTLASVIFTWTLSQDTNGTLRHLELHEPGRVEHGLYLGDHDNLGRQVPLTEHPTTADLAAVVDMTGGVATGLAGLDVVYVPNVPNPAWRTDPVGADQGAADIAGVEPVLDAADEAATSWMRDIRLGKARIVVPHEYLTTHGPGQGASVDLDREVFVPVRAPLSKDAMQMHAQQFTIRHQEHANTVLAWTERAVTGAGYSAQTFGLTSEVAMTATESHARERRTHETRGSKVRRWAEALAHLAEIMLTIDRLVFGARVVPQRPTVEFPDLVSPEPEQQARALQMLDAAGAISTETMVERLNPDWDEEQVAAEVARIRDAEGPDPAEVMRGTAGRGGPEDTG